MPRAEAVAGAQGVVRLLVPPDIEIRALGELVATTEARIVMCELPDNASPLSDLLLERGFIEEGRVRDYYADGIALRILVKRATRHL